jgi:hypothetical protein
MDLIRLLLLKLEKIEMEPGDIFHFGPEDEELRIEDRDWEAVANHMLLLIDEDLVHAEWTAGGFFIYRRITWHGYDFLDSIRDEKIWAATKEGARKAGGFTVDILLDLSKALIKRGVEQHLGFSAGH